MDPIIILEILMFVAIYFFFFVSTRSSKFILLDFDPCTPDSILNLICKNYGS